MAPRNKHIGSDFSDFLADEGIQEEVEATAIKRVIAFQIEQEMKKRHLNKSTMARRMHTSRSAVDRLFDPNSESVTLRTLNKAASVLGKKLKVQLV